MSDNPLFSSFMMLPEKLYQEFVQYIVQGRSRAPPETALIEMLPTFQFGAKTDRRALQSKFKSWAKRMTFENGYLKLSNSGKIIIPKEKCDDLIMYLHSEKHHDIDKIISKIRTKYTWTRKNFGMDRNVVVQSIMSYCKKEDCHKSMRMEMARLGISLCSSQPSSQMSHLFPEMTFRMPPPMPCLPPYVCWPLAFPGLSVFPPSELPFRFPFFNDMHSIKKPSDLCNKTMANPMSDEINVSKLGKKPNTGGINNKEKNPPSSSNASEKKSALPFRKPKNVHEYKTLMEAVRNKPTEFPQVLRLEKNQFLSILGLAPKSVCSSRTLKKFLKELKYKRLMNRECMIYRHRKVLRDKNKLKKFSHEKSNRVFLGMTARKEPTPTTSEKTQRNETVTSKQTRLPLEVSRKLNPGQNDEYSAAKRLKILHIERSKTVEVINIASSDDEIQSENASVLRETKQQEEFSISETEKQIFGGFETQVRPNTPVSSNRKPETTKKLPCVGTDMKTSEENGDKIANSHTIVNHGQNKKDDEKENTDKIANSHTIVNHGQNKKDDEKENTEKNADSGKNITHRKNENFDDKIESFKLTNLGNNFNAEKSQSNVSAVRKHPVHEINNRIFHVKPILFSKKENSLPKVTQLLNLTNNRPDSSRLQTPQIVSPEVAPLSNSTPKYSNNYLFTQANTTPIVLQPITPSTGQPHFVIANQNTIPRIVYSLPVSSSPASTKLYRSDGGEQNKKLYIIPSQNVPILPKNYSKRESQATFNDSKVTNMSVFTLSDNSQMNQLRQMNPGYTYAKGSSLLERMLTKEKTEININKEMERISRWIYGMKANLNPNMFQTSIEKSVQLILSQLDVGIYLVREAKKCLAEIENSQNDKIAPTR